MSIDRDKIEAASHEEFKAVVIRQWSLNRRRQLMETTSEETRDKIQNVIAKMEEMATGDDCCCHVCPDCEYMCMHNKGPCGKPRITPCGCKSQIG